MNKKSSYLLLKSLLIGFCLSLALPAAAVESKDPIKLTIHDWTGQYLTTHIMGEVLKQAGYNIEYVQEMTHRTCESFSQISHTMSTIIAMNSK